MWGILFKTTGTWNCDKDKIGTNMCVMIMPLPLYVQLKINLTCSADSFVVFFIATNIDWYYILHYYIVDTYFLNTKKIPEYSIYATVIWKWKVEISTS